MSYRNHKVYLFSITGAETEAFIARGQVKKGFDILTEK